MKATFEFNTSDLDDAADYKSYTHAPELRRALWLTQQLFERWLDRASMCEGSVDISKMHTEFNEIISDVRDVIEV